MGAKERTEGKGRRKKKSKKERIKRLTHAHAAALFRSHFIPIHIISGFGDSMPLLRARARSVQGRRNISCHITTLRLWLWLRVDFDFDVGFSWLHQIQDSLQSTCSVTVALPSSFA